jgi:hypothetical protein
MITLVIKNPTGDKTCWWLLHQILLYISPSGIIYRPNDIISNKNYIVHVTGKYGE